MSREVSTSMSSDDEPIGNMATQVYPDDDPVSSVPEFADEPGSAAPLDFYLISGEAVRVNNVTSLLTGPEFETGAGIAGDPIVDTIELKRQLARMAFGGNIFLKFNRRSSDGPVSVLP